MARPDEPRVKVMLARFLSARRILVIEGAVAARFGSFFGLWVASHSAIWASSPDKFVEGACSLGREAVSVMGAT